ncbi:MAG: O-antigen ligase family protein [Gammaproteobacteria bacterium]|nr:O-antigen ligase family protein [Gammaproteobacteria bacterium]
MHINIRHQKYQTRDWLRYVIALLVLIFPMVAATVKDGSGVVFALLFLLGIIYGWPAWKSLCKQEKLMLYGFVAFFIVASISLLNTENMAAGIRKLERYLYFPLSIPIYLLLRRYGEYVGRALIIGCVLAGFIYAADAWYDTAVLGKELASGAYHKIIFGDFSVLLAVLIFLMAIELNKNRLLKILMLCSAIAALYAGVLSMTRGAWILLPVAMVVAAWFYRQKITRRQILMASAGVLLAIIALAALKPERIVGGVESGFSDINRTLQDPSQPSSWGERILMWKDALLIWQNNPWLGTGIGDYEGHRAQLKEQGLTEYPKPYEHAHSIYFDALATTGMLGVAALLIGVFILPASLLSGLKDAEKLWLIAASMVLVAFAVFGLTEGWLSRSAMVKGGLLFLLMCFSAAQINYQSRP